MMGHLLASRFFILPLMLSTPGQDFIEEAEVIIFEEGTQKEF